MYYRCLLDDMLRSNRHFHLVAMNCSLKALIYRIPLRLMLWGASCYTKILSRSCDKTFDIPTFPKSQLLEWKLISFVNLFIQIPSTALDPLSISGTLVRTTHPLLPISGAIAYGPWSRSDYYQNHSFNEGEKRYPG